MKYSIKNKFLLFYVLLSAIFYFSLNPLIAGDTGGYTGIAKIFSSFTTAGYDWARTPGYPIYIFAISYLISPVINIYPDFTTSQVICLGQLVLFIYAVMDLYNYLESNQSTTTANISLIIISPLLAVYAKYILPESLCLSLCILVTSKILSKKYEAVSYLIAVLVFLKPNFLPVAILISLYFRMFDRKTVFIPLIAIFLTISAANYIHTKSFSLTNIGGFSKSQVVYNLFDRVHPNDKIIGEIMHKEYLTEKNENRLRADTWTRSTSMMYEKTNLMPYEKSKEEWMNGTVLLSNYIGKVSNYLVIENPKIVIQNTYKILPETFNYDMPIITNGTVDPHTIDKYPEIKSAFGYEIYTALQPIYSKMLLFLELSSIAISIFYILFKKDFFYILPLSIIISNKLIISFFGVFDTRYNIVLIPFMILPFLYMRENKPSLKISSTH